MQAVSREHQREIISRRLLRAMGLLVASSLVLVTYARLTDRPLEAVPADGPVAQERMIHISATNGGAATVTDESGRLIADLPPNKGGFVAGVWRSVVFERGRSRVDPDAAIRLVRFEDGRLALKDDLTGWRIELVGFGADNSAAFAQFLK